MVQIYCASLAQPEFGKSVLETITNAELNLKSLCAVTFFFFKQTYILYMADDKRCVKKKHKLRLKEGPALLGSWSVSNHSYHTSKQHSKNTLNVLAATY